MKIESLSITNVIPIKTQLVLFGEGTDFIFLYRGLNNFHHR